MFALRQERTRVEFLRDRYSESISYPRQGKCLHFQIGTKSGQGKGRRLHVVLDMQRWKNSQCSARAFRLGPVVWLT